MAQGKPWFRPGGGEKKRKKVDREKREEWRREKKRGEERRGGREEGKKERDGKGKERGEGSMSDHHYLS